MLLPRDFDWRIVTNTRRFECLFCVLFSMCRGFSGYLCARNGRNRRNFVEFWVNFPPFCTEEERIFLGEKSNWAITWKTRANSISRSRIYRVYSTSGDPSSAQRILSACPIHAWVIRRRLRDSRLIWFGSCELWQMMDPNLTLIRKFWRLFIGSIVYHLRTENPQCPQQPRKTGSNIECDAAERNWKIRQTLE